ncbi:MAG: Mth938-like domain-containing protein [Enhydrobacter sp.]|nr:MAG: Mth938-like domain-containing protein [Enhydrobacter sp.]
MMPPRQDGPSDKSLPTPDPAQVQLIRGYGPGRFLIGEREWREPVVVAPAETRAWPVASAEELSPDTIGGLPGVELLVVGCGARTVFVPPDRRQAFKAGGVALEVVETGAACRIYNVLLAEGRRVAAALIPL